MAGMNCAAAFRIGRVEVPDRATSRRSVSPQNFPVSGRWRCDWRLMIQGANGHSANYLSRAT